MRLIGSVKDRRLAQEFSYFLVKEGIANNFEPHIENGEETYQIWVVEEDDTERAAAELTNFLANPNNEKYHGHYQEAKRIEDAHLEKLRERRAADERISRRIGHVRPIGIITILLIAASTIILFFGSIDFIPVKEGEPRMIIVTKQPYSALLFDFPKPFQLFDQLATHYPAQELENPHQLPPEGRALLDEAFSLPYWQGIYPMVVEWLNPKLPAANESAPLFVKIGEGEVWRLFTPALLHIGFVHLLFNMIWLFVLGSQIEARIGLLRYSLVILLSALVTNVGQYLMSGPLFMGMSGVVVALFGFIWVRQHRAPWEGYQLHRITIAFIIAFIVAMLIFQIVSFAFEVANRGSIGPPIANTAHIVGLLVGALLGRFDFFAFHDVRGGRPVSK